MAIALRPRPSASRIMSRWGSHALACGLRPGRGGHGTGAESVDTSLAGFAGGGSVDTALAGFGTGRRPHPPGDRTAIPAAFKYALAVSRRTPVASSIRRSGHPSRPSTSTSCRFASLKTLAIPATSRKPAARSTSEPIRYWPVFSCRSLAGFGCPPRRRSHPQPRAQFRHVGGEFRLRGVARVAGELGEERLEALALLARPRTAPLLLRRR